MGMYKSQTTPASGLNGWGWNRYFEEQWQALLAEGAVEGLVRARVSGLAAGICRVVLEQGEEILVDTAGTLRGNRERAVVGDWALIRRDGERGLLVRLLTRRTSLSRRDPAGGEQVLASNLDTALLMTSLNQELNLRRLERYFTLTAGSGVTPVVLLSKLDLVDNSAEALKSVQAIAPGVPVLSISAEQGLGLEALEAWLTPGQTAVLLGSSGVGKSTLVNRLLGEERLATAPVREHDDRGRHTTTGRHLLRLPGGALLIDTPGLRELLPWAGEAGLALAFSEIGELAPQCRFRDCKHQGEPGCAVQAEVDAGKLDAARLENYHRLGRELEYEATRGDKAAEAKYRRAQKRLHGSYAQIQAASRKRKGGGK